MPFPAEEYEQRRAGVRAAMAERRLDAMVVTSPEDVYYLSGLNNQGHFVFTALVLDTTGDTGTLVAREMEAPTAAVQSPSAFVGYRDGDDPAGTLAGVLCPPGRVPRRIGYQPGSLSFPVAVWQALGQRLGSPTWVDCAAMLNDARAMRSDREVDHLRRAGRLSDVGMRAGVAAASGECTGGEIVGAVEQRCCRREATTRRSCRWSGLSTS